MEEMVKKIDDESFTKTIATGNVLVDFSAEWCGPCKMLAPVLESLAGQLQGKVRCVQIDVDQSPKATTSYQITSVPTLVLFVNGKETQRIVGLKDLQTLSKTVLAAL